ncbi:hypothetical protein CLAFUW4_13473 [Fulvia fulva]|uniref:Uncharacterized protein n=1 Tax=Passalora fulva TaxID=5499 RepID=A0A9Q8UVD1_PASFU|nr:uncharacterized protein CLAFUR5_13326 [Fulvia fulva]KAK4612249.1 hypothetical protein CLAFUR4_13476 [Fulvia fulva]KAK4612412.1 hypothetical protein CLAFUR0_13484 [Fulvia fulva]UJO23843.1 hypothetical protein CLAFUR5_13326 [Fulvia fulva]WPV21263.1 hypothetical protein CLAFUW4_13473 [Fulvia fulva]WPV35964.1 hypothetical protein CLAFUW7_13480 [Fulvia fulva]
MECYKRFDVTLKVLRQVEQSRELRLGYGLVEYRNTPAALTKKLKPILVELKKARQASGKGGAVDDVVVLEVHNYYKG